ncbi:hypothetical protein [Nocardioides coralli]|uniref:hypothetical protein n=1 Tax=Nocardioides coralli TaxID=2872154 RepID=UPI001CA3E89A|nr:hypothetical protein [Nocardioides coralli]QZY27680.1 hypothetical protein K6T13_09110 [Nocardioides coralli]
MQAPARLDGLPAVHLRRELVGQGMTDHAIAREVARGNLHKVRHGAYTAAAPWHELDEGGRYALLCVAAAAQARTDVVLSHLSAAGLWGAPLWDVSAELVHLTRTDQKTGRKEAGIQQHRGILLPEDVWSGAGVQVMSPTRAALELTTLTDVEHAVVEIDWLLHTGLTDVQKLRTRYAATTSWPNTLHTDLVLRLVDGRSESVLESRGRFMCWSQRLPTPIPNYPIRNRRGRVVARVDLAWPELGVFVELDGKVKYETHRRPGESVTDAVVREKRRESMIVELTGWRCIRLVWADLRHPAACAARIRAGFRPTAA